jgi:hypothetical protein
MATNKRRILRTQREKGLTKTGRDLLLTGYDWFNEKPFADESEQREAWNANREDLNEEWEKDNGMFSRCWAWWEYDAPEPTQAGDTEAAYLERHPQLLTQAEKNHLQDHGLTKWQRMPASELADLDQFINSPNWRALLNADELEALNQHIAMTQKRTVQ